MITDDARKDVTGRGVRPGDGFLAEHSRRAALTAHQEKAGEESMVGRADAGADVRDGGWRARAACRNTTDPDTFFPVAEDGPAFERAVAAAKRVCAGCPVRGECAAWAIEALPHGVAGGMSAEERHQARQARPAGRTSACSTAAPYEVSAGARALPARHRAPVIAAGKVALAHGVARNRVAAEFGVTRRTVDRWAADQLRASAADMSGVSGGSGVVVSGGGR